MDEIIGPATYIPPMAPIDITMAMERTEIGREMLELGEASPLEIITDRLLREFRVGANVGAPSGFLS